MTRKAGETFVPPANTPPGSTMPGRLRFLARAAADLQVASVLRHLRPWLAARTGKLLEVGCGAQPYRHLVPESCSYTGLDWDQAEAGFAYRNRDTVYYGGDRFPFDDGTFDCLCHTEVLEHVFEPGRFLGECRRVLRPGGRIFFTVPFQARYHYIPHDYFRYTPAALERLLAEAGFGETVITPRGNDICVAAYKCLAVSYRWLREGWPGRALGLVSLPVAACALVAGQATLRLRVGSADDCLGYSVEATALAGAEGGRKYGP